MSDEVGIEQARANLGDLANRAHYAGQIAYITRRGRRIAAIVPINRITQETAMPATTQDLAYQVSLTLGDHIGDYDIDAIVEEIGTTYGYDIPNIDAVPTSEYWKIVEKHDTTARRYTLTVVEGDPGLDANGTALDDAPIGYGDLPDEVTDWLEQHGFTPDHPDRWVLVTPGGQDPDAVNVIASRTITV